MIEGFWVAAVKPLGPVQLYVALAIFVADKLSVAPSQIALLLAAVGGFGVGFMLTTVELLALKQPFTETNAE